MEKDEEYKWPMKEQEVAVILGKRDEEEKGDKGNIRPKIKDLKDKGEFIEGKDEDYFLDRSIPRPGSPEPFRMITERGAIKIAHTVNTDEAKEFLSKRGIIPGYNPEAYFIGIIKKAIKGFTDYETQHYVKFDNHSYGLIDLYLKDWNIAIECDEMGHKNKDELDEKERESKIKEKLGCKIIRFNPDDPDFNIGDVINKIFSEIIPKKSLKR